MLRSDVVAAMVWISASPCSTKYVLDYNGAGPSFTSITQAQLVSEAAAGPLRALLASIDDDAAWLALPQNPRLSIYVSDTSDATLGKAYFNNPAPGTRELRGKCTNVGTSIVEIRFHHSLGR